MRRILVVIALSLLLPACVTLKSITLEPTYIGNGYMTASYVGTWCQVGGGLSELGTMSPFNPGPGQALVGFSDFYQRGSDPFPCVEREDQYYRSSVVFDLSNFDHAIATLTYDVTTPGTFTVVSSIPTCTATVLGMATSNDNWSYDNPVDLTAGFDCPAHQNVDVTSQVQMWITSHHSNFGFLFAGPKITFPDPLPDDNITQVSFYSNVRLLLLYNPAMNPRAPQ